jgi:hypothetical protein
MIDIQEVMMNFLTPVRDPMFETFYKKFDNIFSEPSQKENFRLYGTGLMLEIKRKNIWYINEHILETDYQPMHHFMRDAPWGENRLNDQRVEMMDSNTSTRSCYDGYAIIDDTGNPKSGDCTHATRKQWMGSLGKVERGQVVVTSHYVDSRKDWPIDHRPYLPQKWVEEQNASLEHNRNNPAKLYVFKSKLILGLELVDDIRKRGIRFSHLLVDAWYGNSPDFIKGVESRKCLYITSLYANRHIYFRLPGEESVREHSVKELVISLDDDAFPEVQYTKANGEVRKVYVADITLKVKNLPGERRVLIVKPTPQEKDMKNIDVHMSNDTLSDVPSMLRGWSFRDAIDKFYLRGKDDLGFDQYQVRDDKPIRRHWYMVFLMYSFIIWHRQCGSFRKWCTHTCQTFGNLLDVIRTKLMLHFHKWCVENPERWQAFLQNEKGIPMAEIMA